MKAEFTFYDGSSMTLDQIDQEETEEILNDPRHLYYGVRTKDGMLYIRLDAVRHIKLTN